MPFKFQQLNWEEIIESVEGGNVKMFSIVYSVNAGVWHVAGPCWSLSGTSLLSQQLHLSDLIEKCIYGLLTYEVLLLSPVTDAH